MSAGVTCCVPEIHWRLLMVGRGGMRSAGLRRMSCAGSLEAESKRVEDVSLVSHDCHDGEAKEKDETHNRMPVPKTFTSASSAGPFQPNTSPVLVRTASEKRRTSSTWPTWTAPISLSAGREYARAQPSP